MNPGVDTLPGRLRARAVATPAGVACLQKRHGIWRHHTWAGLAQRVEDLALGFAATLPAGATVGVVSGRRVEALEAILACQLAGLRPLVLHPTLPPGALASQCDEAGAAALVAEDQEQVDKAADVLSRLPRLSHLFVIDPKGVRGYRHVRAVVLDDVVRHGGATAGRAAALEALAGRGASTEALALFSGGVEGDARLLGFDHARLLAVCEAAIAGLALVAGERLVAQFALADPLGFCLQVGAPAVGGVQVCFGEGRHMSAPELRQASPNVFAASGRELERMRRESVARIERSGGLRAGLFARAMRGDARRGWSGWLVGRPLVNALGLGRARRVLAAYGALSTSTRAFFDRLGVAIDDLFAVADLGGPVGLLSATEERLLATFAHAEAAVDEAARLRLRWTAASEWVATGDVARAGTAGIALVGRASECLRLAAGAEVVAGTVERALVACPYINQAVAVGGPATGVTALVELDETAVRDWARERGLAFTTSRSLAVSPEVGALVEAAVHEANRVLPEPARVRRHIVLPRPLDPANGELSAALVVRRTCVRNRYAHLLAAPAVASQAATNP